MTDESRARTADLMTVVLGREVRDFDTVHCGAFTPLVLASGMWAMAHHAPNVAILPISLTGVRNHRAFPISLSLLEGMSLAAGVQYPMVDIFTHVEGVPGCSYEPVNPLQMDAAGNVNTSVIGPYESPSLRGPGPAGLDILTIMMRDQLILYCPRHHPDILVPKVDFVTAVGNDPDRRRDAGLAAGGVRKLVTNLCVMRLEPSGVATLESLHPGVTVQDVRDATGFPVEAPESVPTTRPATDEELRVLADIDPLRIRDLEFMSAKQRRRELPRLWDAEWDTFHELAMRA